MKRAPLRGLVAAVLLVGAWMLWTPSPSAAPRPSFVSTSVPEAPTIVIYGDSLVESSQARIASTLTAAYPNAKIKVRAFGGTALCDWLESMKRDRALAADVAVIEFSGNAFTPCIKRRADTAAEVAASYRADASKAVDIIRGEAASSTRIVFVGTPPAVWAPPGPHPLDEGYRAATARSGGVTFDLAPQRALALTDSSGGSGSGIVFPSAMPCLLSERGLSECVNGQIQVRAADGLHFCPAEDLNSGPCALYSSGVVRFGDAVASAALNALDGSARPVIE